MNEKNRDEGDQTTDESIEVRFKETTERLWAKTRRTFSSATHTAGSYGRIVQKKVDLGALQRKINAAYSDLGQLVDQGRLASDPKILESAAVQEAFKRLDEFKDQVAALEQEIETLKAESGNS